jgi:uncharacterized membrane protein YoaT (DUF817 family)
MYKGNAKRPKNICFYPSPQIEDSTDLTQFISMIFGIISFILKVKWGIWISLILFLSSWVNLKYNSDQKNIMMNFSLIIMGFFMIYLAPKPRQNIQPTQPKK